MNQYQIMTPEIILSPCETTSNVHDWLTFNDIPFHHRDLWCQQEKSFCLWPDICNSILFADINIIRDSLSEPPVQYLSADSIRDFCSRGNQLCILGTDLGLDTVTQHQELWRSIDDVIPKSGMIFLLDGQPLESKIWKNICPVVCMANDWNRPLPRYQSPSLVKHNAEHDYLLTMVLKPNRPHRQVLWHELTTRSGVLDRGLVMCRPKHTYDAWLGRKSAMHELHECHPSMDLYLDCFLEIVPETNADLIYTFTEKTQKPIITRTPFLMASAPGHLDWLKSLGFRTFGSLIDESYDQEHNMDDRIRLMVDVLQHIIRQGSKDFYWACQDILDHNLSRAFEMSGSWEYRFDTIMWQLLEEFQDYQRRYR